MWIQEGPSTCWSLTSKICLADQLTFCTIWDHLFIILLILYYICMLKATIWSHARFRPVGVLAVVGNPWWTLDVLKSGRQKAYELFDRRRVSAIKLWKPMRPGTVLENAIRHFNLIFQGILIYRKWTQSLFFHPHSTWHVLAAFQCVQHVSVFFFNCKRVGHFVKTPTKKGLPHQMLERWLSHFFHMFEPWLGAGCESQSKRIPYGLKMI